MTKIGLRNAWFQVHKWIGLILAILIIPLCVTGAALVWDDALDHALNPQRYAVSGSATLAPERYVAAARAVLAPNERIAQIAFPEVAGDPVVVTAIQMPAKGALAAPPRPGPPPRTTFWLDPPTARVLDRDKGGGGLIRTMHMIHGTMLIPGVGRQIVGWIGVAMLVSSISGLWLWWPTVGKWVRGLRWRRHRNTDTNLHHLFGFWIALPLFVLSLTGAWISFPQVFGGGPRGGGGAGPSRAALARAKPLPNPRLSLDTAIASAGAAAPGDVRQVAWPTDLKPEWRVTLAGTQVVTVTDDSGAAQPEPVRPDDTPRLMRRIHDGTRMGPVWQTIIFLGGLLPAILAITGIIMWWRARGWKAKLKARRGLV